MISFSVLIYIGIGLTVGWLACGIVQSLRGGKD